MKWNGLVYGRSKRTLEKCLSKSRPRYPYGILSERGVGRVFENGGIPARPPFHSVTYNWGVGASVRMLCAWGYAGAGIGFLGKDIRFND